MLSQSARREALLDVVLLRRPLAEAIADLRRFPRDSDVQLVVLTRAHALGVVDAVLTGRLTPEEAEEWANCLEVREDLGFVPADDELLGDVIFTLANPILTEPLTRDAAMRWRARLVEPT